MLEEKLQLLKSHEKTRIMIIGLGSVGNYLLDYLLSTSDENIEIITVGRNAEKMQCDVNIARVASLIRHQNRTNVIVEGGVDLENIESITECLEKYQPDIIVNTSRVYAGLKYGSISWKNIRAYGIWIPLSIKYIRNIMLAYKKAYCDAIVINTSYSDGTIPWLKCSGVPYPDFGSGNLNHLLPRIKFAVAAENGIEDFWNIDVGMATAHFHDVVISKEGQSEGVPQLVKIFYRGREIKINQDDIFKKSVISMPVDAKRNMMNASSNFDIIQCILNGVRKGREEIFHSPGAFGEIGGYPILLDGKNLTAKIDTSIFSMEEMREKNRQSLYLDGIERIENSCMTYTDELIQKTRRAFGVTLPKTVHFDEIDQTAEYIIKNIIEPQLGR